MPDINSFYFSAKNQEGIDATKVTNKKKIRGKRRHSDSFEEEVMPT